jgi:ribulose-phosphate 3-epimerase
MAKVAPSILSADFAKLGEEVRDVCGCGIDYLHIDVMDGRFVPNISFGADVMKSITGYSDVPLDVHLMIEEPDRYLESFVTDKTEFITVHQEACVHLDRTIQHIKSLGVKAGVSINPATPVSVLKEVLVKADLILVMSVNPGFGGQKFIESALTKISELASAREENGYEYLIEVDGGINGDNAAKVVSAGADILVAGSYVFKSEDREKAIKSLK